MGCVSSKILKKSKSFHEELMSLSLQKRIVDFPTLEDLFVRPNKDRAEFLTQLCTLDTVSKNQETNNSSTQSESAGHESKTTQKILFPLPEPDVKDDSSLTQESDVIYYETINSCYETINSWDLMAGLEDEEEDKRNEEGNPVQREASGDLTFPAEFYFQSVGSLRDWMVMNHCNDGKHADAFVDYSSKTDCSQEAFDPVMLTSFEESMKVLSVEEESAIRFIEEIFKIEEE